MSMFNPAATILISISLMTGCALTQRAMPSTMSDADIVSLFNAIDESEIEGAQIARRQASSQLVREYADRLVSEHTALLRQKHVLADKIHMQPDKPALTLSIETANRDMLEALAKTSGLDFDRAYVDYQIAMHNEALDIVEDTAIYDSRLKQQLQDSRLDFIAHAAKARSIRQQLLASSASALPEK